MAGLSSSAVADIITSTLPKLPEKGRFDTTLEYQDYPVVDKWFRDHKRKAKSGESISERVQLRETGTAQHVGLYQSTGNTNSSTLEAITAGWVHTEAKMTWERREFVMNAEPAQIVSLLKARRTETYQALANLIERDVWFAPDSSSDFKAPLGVPYWICPLAPGVSSSTGGFNGTTVVYGDGSTSTTTGGINRSLAANRRFRNWADLYTTFGPTALQSLRVMMRRINFRGPSYVRKSNGSLAPQWGIYTNQDLADQYESMVNSGPDDKKGDMSPFNGMLSYKKVPWYAVPALDEITYNPIYVLNHAHFFPYVLAGEWMREDDEALREPGARNTFTVGIDCSWQIFCTNVRAGGGVLHQAISA